MPRLLAKFLFYFVVYMLSLITGIGVILKWVYIWIRSPSDTNWKVKNRPVPPKCLNDPEFGNHNYVQIKNVKIHYVEKGDRTKPLMLFLHGFPEFWYSWRHQIREFSKDYWVVAPDLRGYGDSEKPDGIRFYQTEYLVQDIKNLLEAFQCNKVTLVGHDWGGVIAWYFVMLNPDLIETYVIMNAPYPLTFRKHLMKNFTQLRMSWYVFFFQLPYLPEISLRLQDMKSLNMIFYTKKDPSPYSEEDKEAYRFTHGKPGALTPPLNYYRANLDNLKLIKKLKSAEKKLPPGLLLFGENDTAIHLDSIRKTDRYIPNLTIEIIRDATHFVQQDDPEAVNKLMREYLNNLPKIKTNEPSQNQEETTK